MVEMVGWGCGVQGLVDANGAGKGRHGSVVVSSLLPRVL